MAEGEFALARHHLEQALVNLEPEHGDHQVYTLLAENAARQRDAAALRQYTPIAEQLAVDLDHRLFQAISHRAWGIAHRLAGEFAEAEARLRRALEIFRGQDTRWQIGRTLGELGELAVARNHAGEAEAHFSQALAAFEEIGAAPDAARARAALEALGSRRRKPF